MRSLFPKANKRIFSFINQLDPDPGKKRPVTFWFYSDSEEKIYRLAGRLQHAGYTIVNCAPSLNDKFLCIAELRMIPDNDRINRLCIDMHLLAEKMDVTFDGWETEMRGHP